jgi:hypothetical protein
MHAHGGQLVLAPSGEIPDIPHNPYSRFHLIQPAYLADKEGEPSKTTKDSFDFMKRKVRTWEEKRGASAEGMRDHAS